MIELTGIEDDKWLINPSWIVTVHRVVYPPPTVPYTIVALMNGTTVFVKETVEDVKKSMGMKITPRAETLAQFVV